MPKPITSITVKVVEFTLVPSREVVTLVASKGVTQVVSKGVILVATPALTLIQVTVVAVTGKILDSFNNCSKYLMLKYDVTLDILIAHTKPSESEFIKVDPVRQKFNLLTYETTITLCS